jgi:V/A-type H+-transporting ATPase subunit A
MIREDFLQQHAYHEVDSYCSLEKQLLMLKVISLFHKKALEVIDLGVGVDKIIALSVKDEIARMKYVAGDQFKQKHEELEKTINEQFDSLRE